MEKGQSHSPIGIFDSGVGGLSVLRKVKEVLPDIPLIYFADQAHVPYGPRSLDEVRQFSEIITRFLISKGARLIIVACNTASAGALHYLRKAFPAVAFVGMEPAVKPAAEQTTTGKVGVLATPATFQGALYASVVERFANGVEIFQDTCAGLVKAIESGDLNGPNPRAILERALTPMLASGIDTIVLGCTHYPFAIPLIEKIAGPQVRVIDPAPAIARQTERLYRQIPRISDIPADIPIRDWFITSGNPRNLEQLTAMLLKWEIQAEKAEWQSDSLQLI
jgi:glutamate racemase